MTYSKSPNETTRLVEKTETHVIVRSLLLFLLLVGRCGLGGSWGITTGSGGGGGSGESLGVGEVLLGLGR